MTLQSAAAPHCWRFHLPSLIRSPTLAGGIGTTAGTGRGCELAVWCGPSNFCTSNVLGPRSTYLSASTQLEHSVGCLRGAGAGRRGGRVRLDLSHLLVPDTPLPFLASIMMRHDGEETTWSRHFMMKRRGGGGHGHGDQSFPPHCLALLCDSTVATAAAVANQRGSRRRREMSRFFANGARGLPTQGGRGGRMAAKIARALTRSSRSLATTPATARHDMQI